MDGDGPVRVLTLNRPEHLNAISASMHTSLSCVWRELAADTDARCVVLTGAGRAFSAGGDLNTISSLQMDPQERRRQLKDAGTIVGEMLRFPLPIVAAVNGAAVGLGCSLALLADLVYMSHSAYLADPHVRIGLTAGDGGAALWPLLTSVLRAKEFLYTGDRVSAEDAFTLGLATRIFPDSELLGAAMSMAHRLASLPSQAIQSTKQAINLHLARAIPGVLDYALAEEYKSFDTEEHREEINRLGGK